ncbi:hypothetical protein GLOTRDRAFT_108826 [Gloeophyllum trabeum ATCC 11539]|uniref:Uncharacterized protein n=1 Tax=Gloeophyllum trabeum (strain ATCC 11539 / FP-39264 / Madison 617) TaxID=670483 RepID=S7S2W9_GLOTA|nr:uncharacterized protein GLOTRDRAFT_108826 [Gloeophyllum trabeum ATCC 11539]EPQ60149.1 hypothetical protein GLOTRDRAFT_108826 [Gloeophyllum trabeum ATCC 11539]
MGRVDGERMRGTISRGTGKERGRGRVVTSIFQGVDADGQGLTREGSGGSEESVPAPAELEKDTAVLEPFEPKSRDAEVQSPLVATTEAQVQSEAASSLDAAVQSPVVLTADVEVQSPIVQTAEAEVQSPVVRTVDVQVQSQGSPEDHDNTEAVIQELEKKLEESKAVIEQFKKRLEGVEKGIEEMEKTEAPVIHAASKPPVTVPDTTVARRPKSRVGVATCLVNRLFRVIGLSSPAVNAEGRREQEMDVGDLPSYVFLVGLGVCAVVLKTLVRRMKRGVR